MQKTAKVQHIGRIIVIPVAVALQRQALTSPTVQKTVNVSDSALRSSSRGSSRVGTSRTNHPLSQKTAEVAHTLCLGRVADVTFGVAHPALERIVERCMNAAVPPIMEGISDVEQITTHEHVQERLV